MPTANGLRPRTRLLSRLRRPRTLLLVGIFVVGVYVTSFFLIVRVFEVDGDRPTCLLWTSRSQALNTVGLVAYYPLVKLVEVDPRFGYIHPMLPEDVRHGWGPCLGVYLLQVLVIQRLS